LKRRADLPQHDADRRRLIIDRDSDIEHVRWVVAV
jgi:hypothetical protein